jgi:hypothetical protein
MIALFVACRVQKWQCSVEKYDQAGDQRRSRSICFRPRCRGTGLWAGMNVSRRNVMQRGAGMTIGHIC